MRQSQELTREIIAHALDAIVIVNESGIYSKEWQLHMIRYLKHYLKSKDRIRPVGMTAMVYYPPGGSNEALFDSEADWVSPGWNSGRYLNDGCARNRHGRLNRAVAGIRCRYLCRLRCFCSPKSVCHTVRS